MTDEERKDATAQSMEACAKTDIDDEGERMSFKIGFKRGYAAACEAKRAESVQVEMLKGIIAELYSTLESIPWCNRD